MLTAHHVVADADAITVEFRGDVGRRPRPQYDARVFSFDDRADWALLLLTTSPDVPVVELSSMSAVDAIGEWVEFHGYGFPLDPRDVATDLLPLGKGFQAEPRAILPNSDGRLELQLYVPDLVHTAVHGLSGAPIFAGNELVAMVQVAETLQRERPNDDARDVEEGDPLFEVGSGTLLAIPSAILRQALLRSSAEIGILPPLPEPRHLPEIPFRYLRAYRAEDALLFAGRTATLTELFLSCRRPEAAPVILLYGTSGVGKTSLIAAGLGPRLESGGGTQVAVVRCGVSELDSLIRRKLRAISGESLSDAWMRLEESRSVPLCLVIDQAEQPLTTEAGEADLRAILIELSSLLSKGQPYRRLVISHRREWFDQMSSLLQEVGLRFERILVEPLRRDQVLEVLHEVERYDATYRLKFDKDAADAIVDAVSRDAASNIAPRLQILLSRLWDDVANVAGTRVIAKEKVQELLATSGDLAAFLQTQLDSLTGRFPAVVESGLALDLLEYHTTSLGSARERGKQDLSHCYRHTDLVKEEQWDPLIEALVDLSLLMTATGGATRLTHDALAPVVRVAFQSSVRPAQRARRRLEAADEDSLTEQQLERLTEALPTMRRPSDAELRHVIGAIARTGFDALPIWIELGGQSAGAEKEESAVVELENVLHGSGAPDPAGKALRAALRVAASRPWGPNAVAKVISRAPDPRPSNALLDLADDDDGESADGARKVLAVLLFSERPPRVPWRLERRISRLARRHWEEVAPGARDKIVRASLGRTAGAGLLTLAIFVAPAWYLCDGIFSVRGARDTGSLVLNAFFCVLFTGIAVGLLAWLSSDWSGTRRHAPFPGRATIVQALVSGLAVVVMSFLTWYGVYGGTTNTANSAGVVDLLVRSLAMGAAATVANAAIGLLLCPFVEARRRWFHGPLIAFGLPVTCAIAASAGVNLLLEPRSGVLGFGTELVSIGYVAAVSGVMSAIAIPAQRTQLTRLGSFAFIGVAAIGLTTSSLCVVAMFPREAWRTTAPSVDAAQVDAVDTPETGWTRHVRRPWYEFVNDSEDVLLIGPTGEGFRDPAFAVAPGSKLHRQVPRSVSIRRCLPEGEEPCEVLSFEAAGSDTWRSRIEASDGAEHVYVALSAVLPDRRVLQLQNPPPEKGRLILTLGSAITAEPPPLRNAAFRDASSRTIATGCIPVDDKNGVEVTLTAHERPPLIIAIRPGGWTDPCASLTPPGAPDSPLSPAEP